MSERKYLPTLGELLDRLSILQLKEVFIENNREEYEKEISDILHDINCMLEEGGDINLTAELMREIMILGIYNLHIWHNESKARASGTSGEDLVLTHSLNGIRNEAKNRLQQRFGGRKDFKIDCLAAEARHWRPSW